MGLKGVAMSLPAAVLLVDAHHETVIAGVLCSV